jgi:hypothetical protein
MSGFAPRDYESKLHVCVTEFPLVQRLKIFEKKKKIAWTNMLIKEEFSTRVPA